MRKVLAGVLAAAAFAVPGTASADGGSAHYGQCELNVYTDGSGGTLDANVLLYSTVPGDNPVSAEIGCTLAINSNVIFSTTNGGSVLVTQSSEVFFDVTPDDVLTICTIVDYTSNGDPTDTSCYDTYIDDIRNILIDYLNEHVFSRLDPTLCLALKALHPGLPPEVVVTEEGDVYVLGEFVWDCPPYVET
jgi:hypothetical protein